MTQSLLHLVLIAYSELNKWHVDNLITHMAAISLFIDGYKTDTCDLREDLRLENKQYVFSLHLHLVLA